MGLVRQKGQGMSRVNCIQEASCGREAGRCFSMGGGVRCGGVQPSEKFLRALDCDARVEIENT